MNYWIFKAFKNAIGHSEFEGWLDSLIPEDKVKLQLRIDFLKTQRTWERPYVAQRKGHPKGKTKIYEIRCKGVEQKVQLRPLGFYGPEKSEFTFLVGAIEKNGNLEPRNADMMADDRCALAMKDKERYTKYYE